MPSSLGSERKRQPHGQGVSCSAKAAGVFDGVTDEGHAEGEVAGQHDLPDLPRRDGGAVAVDDLHVHPVFINVQRAICALVSDGAQLAAAVAVVDLAAVSLL